MSQGQQSRVRAQSTNGGGAAEDPSVQTTRRSSPTISVPRIIAGALAAASGAFASSWLGLAGTVTGAIFVSIIVSVGTAVYTPPVERSRDVIQRGSRIVLETLPVPAVNRGSTYVGNDLVETRVVPAEPSSEEPRGDVGASEATAQTAAVPPAPAEPEQPAAAATAESLRSRLAWSNIPRHWRRIVATAAVTLVAGFALLTGFELAVGRSAESITGGGGGGTTLGHLVPGNTGHSPAGTPSTTPPSASTPSTGAPTSTLPSTTVPSTSTPPSTPTSTAPATTTPTTTTPSAGGASAGVGGTR